MDELYDYMREKLDKMYEHGADNVAIDMNHAFRLYHMVCYMKQIRGIIEFQDDSCENGKHGKENVR